VRLPPTLRTLVVADGMGPAVASRTPHVDSPPLTLATNRAGGLCHGHRSPRRQQTIRHP